MERASGPVEDGNGPRAPKGPPPQWLKRKMASSQETGETSPPEGEGPRPKARLQTSTALGKAPSSKSTPPKKAAPPAAEAADDTAAPPESASSPPHAAGSDSWRDFADVDPLYALLGELAEKKDVFKQDGSLDQEVMEAYIRRLTQPGVVQKTKSWVEVWAAMNIPVESQVPVVLAILQIGLESEVATTIPDALADLIKNHRVKVKAVEEAVTTLFECGEDEQGCLSRLLFLIFPKSPTSEWGWSRVGWNWQQWWATADRILLALDTKSAYEVLCTLLRSIESDSGTYLPHQQIWDEKRLAVVRAALCKYGGLWEDELTAAFDVCLE